MNLLTLYVFGSCFQLLAVILVSDLEVGGGGCLLLARVGLMLAAAVSAVNWPQGQLQ